MKNNIRKEQTKVIYKRWLTRSRKYSKFPYLITISIFRRNVFLTAADFKGRIKVWTNAGRFGFKGGDKIQYMAIITVTKKFLRKVKQYGIRYVFLKFKNFRQPRSAVRKALRLQKKKKALGLRFLGIWTELHISFNGCRHKKLRRKRKRRYTRRKKIPKVIENDSKPGHKHRRVKIRKRLKTIIKIKTKRKPKKKTIITNKETIRKIIKNIIKRKKNTQKLKLKSKKIWKKRKYSKKHNKQ